MKNKQKQQNYAIIIFFFKEISSSIFMLKTNKDQCEARSINQMEKNSDSHWLLAE